MLAQTLQWQVPLPGITVAGVTTRALGNLALHVGDDAEAVRGRRARFARDAGFAPGQMVCAEQVHGTRVAVVTTSDAGRGAANLADTLPGVDALVTRTPGLLLALFFADCVPVLFADAQSGTVAVAHAGWRGMAAGVLENTLHALQALGAHPRDVQAFVGPGIGPCCFVVGPEVEAQFPHSVTTPGQVDLPGEAARRLRGAGMRAEAIAASGDCTACCTNRWFSHRAEAGKTGRMAAFIGMQSG